MSALKSSREPCPFCGNAAVGLIHDGAERAWSIECDGYLGEGCGAEGPCMATTTAAERAWNRVTEKARAQRIRDIVAQQWAVAIALLLSDDVSGDYVNYWSNGPNAYWSHGPDPDVEQGDGWCLFEDAAVVVVCAALPSAAEIVGGGE